MKANEAPEKLYIKNKKRPYSFVPACTDKNREDDIEYIRTDVFFKKAWDWIEDNMLSSNQQDKSCLYFEQFRNYMKK